MQRRPLTRQPLHLQLFPRNAILDAGAERLGSCFFGGEAGGKTLCSRGTRATIGNLGIGKHAMQEPVAKTFDGTGYARNLDQIDPRAHQHDATVAQCPTFSSQEKENALKSRFLFSDAGSVDDTAELNRGVRGGWELNLLALGAEDAPRTIRFLTGAIMACGGDVLSRGFDTAGTAVIEFEFVRAICVEMYSILIAAGLELSAESHLTLASLCQCTRETLESTAGDPVRAQLVIHPAPAIPKFEGGSAPPRIA